MTGKVGVILNPSKFGSQDRFRELVMLRAGAAGASVCWLETTEADPGGGGAAQALAEGCTLIIAAGGDGTVAAVAAGLVGARPGVRLAVVPVGTGNLFARNLEVPLDVDAALDVAFGSGTRPLDVLESDDRRFLVMAGLGFDAALIRDTSDALKSKIGWLAYLGGLRKAVTRSRRTRFTIQADNQPAFGVTAVGVLVGNIGSLQVGVQLLGDAVPDDGLLDVIVLSPARAAHWLTLAARIVLRQAHRSPRSTVIQARGVSITANESVPIEYDGEFCGYADSMRVTTLPAALQLCCVARRVDD